MRRLLREDIVSSHSDVWYRVAQTRPRLSVHASVVRQSFGESIVYIVEDPAAGQFYRMSEPAYFFLGMLNGRRTVDEAWEACAAQLGDGAPTQRECMQLLASMQRFGLLAGDQPLAADMVRQRRDEATRMAFRKRTGLGLSITIPLANPDPMLERLKGLISLVFSRTGLAVYLVVLAIGLYHVATSWTALRSSFNTDLLTPGNAFWMGVVFILIRAWHELGHASACKAFGGRCTEVGVVLIAMFLPLPYCDASSSWRFAEVWKRVTVGAAGMLFETFVAAICAVVWSRTEPGLVHTLAFNVMLVSGAATLLFNINPLLRYDGYYILSDLVGIPNLSQRSRDWWVFMLQHFVARIPHAQPPEVRSDAESVFLGVYGLLATPYRLFVTFSIIVFLSGKFLTLGILLAAAAAAVWVVWPMLKALAFLFTSPRLMGRRLRALSAAGAAAALAVVVLGVIPVPAAAYATGTIESSTSLPVRAPEAGSIEAVLVAPGQVVKKGDAIARLSSLDLKEDLGAAEARLEHARAERDEALAKSAPEAEVALARFRAAEADVQSARRRVESLAITAPCDGVVVAPAGSMGRLDSALGRYVTRGELIAIIASEELVVRALVSDLDQAYVFRGRGRTMELTGRSLDDADVTATVRVRGGGEPVPAALVRVSPAGQRRVSSAAVLAPAGGEVALDPTDPKQQRTLVPQFVVEARPLTLDDNTLPGVRARVRLAVPPEPLVSQWWRRASQYINSRASTQ